ncbi:hypothetical protein P171DRAFT_487778 [Karstenula rhodostoma CBS 690.94]|uniref:C3H1-type domain-containing protein n=1 Tax=Karstenula rhodostoma CBS 690.94 TaxID=1392251 RepID=A0A9P4PG58_9PLEO|nr:hypothetical protein P171DRAFT_487778 [Karstenula rhodostoma CBS 690.94]
MSPPSAHTRSKGAEPENYPLKGKIGGKTSLGRPKKPFKDRTHKVTEAKIQKPTAGSRTTAKRPPAAKIEPVADTQSTAESEPVATSAHICECLGECKNEPTPVCRKFLQGKCTKKCKFAHPNDPALFERHMRLLEIEEEEKEKESAERDDTDADEKAIVVQENDGPRHACRYGSQCTNARCRFSHY